MLRASVRTKRTQDVSGKVTRGIRRAMRDAADAGFAVAYDEAPSGATNTLRASAVQPTWQGDTLVWGFTADHARYVESGTRPHYPPIAPLKLWARRVLGDESAAYAVQQHIGTHGTPAQGFAEAGFRAMVRDLRTRGLSESIDAELR